MTRPIIRVTRAPMTRGEGARERRHLRSSLVSSLGLSALRRAYMCVHVVRPCIGSEAKGPARKLQAATPGCLGKEEQLPGGVPGETSALGSGGGVPGRLTLMN